MTIVDPTDHDPQHNQYAPQTEVLRQAFKVSQELGKYGKSFDDDLLEGLNKSCHQGKLSGQVVTVTAKNIEWQLEEMSMSDEGLLEISAELYTDLPTYGTHEVSISGFERIETERGTVLLYKFEWQGAPSRRGGSIVGFSPVGYETHIEFNKSTQEAPLAEHPTFDREELPAPLHSEQIYTQVLERLLQKANPALREDANELINLYEKSVGKANADQLIEFGVAAAQLLSHDDVIKDEDARKVILSMTLLLIKRSYPQFIDGHVIEPISGTTEWPIRLGFGVFTVDGAVLLDEYDIVSEEDDNDVEVNLGSTYQPGYRVTDKDGKTFYVPLRYLAEMYPLPDENDHTASNKRFLQYLKDEGENGIFTN
jgi:hypothetical protein